MEETGFVTWRVREDPGGPGQPPGRIAADNMLGRSVTYKKTQGTAICKLFDLAVAARGLNEKRLVQLGLPFEKVYVHSGQPRRLLPRCPPGQASSCCLPRWQRFAGQAIGKDGIDKRIDMLAVAQRAGLTVFDSRDLELTRRRPLARPRT